MRVKTFHANVGHADRGEGGGEEQVGDDDRGERDEQFCMEGAQIVEAHGYGRCDPDQEEEHQGAANGQVRIVGPEHAEHADGEHRGKAPVDAQASPQRGPARRQHRQRQGEHRQNEIAHQRTAFETLGHRGVRERRQADEGKFQEGEQQQVVHHAHPARIGVEHCGGERFPAQAELVGAKDGVMSGSWRVGRTKSNRRALTKTAIRPGNSNPQRQAFGGAAGLDELGKRQKDRLQVFSARRCSQRAGLASLSSSAPWSATALQQNFVASSSSTAMRCSGATRRSMAARESASKAPG